MRARGLDFGTSTTYLVDRQAFRTGIVPLGASTRWLPSIVGVEQARLIPGDAALTLPEAQVLRSAKRSITTGERTRTIWDGRELREVDVDDAILTYLRHVVDRSEESFVSLREPDLNIRVGCPAMWTNEERERLRGLVIAAGMSSDSLALIDEPIAAGVAWIQRRLHNEEETTGKVVVFDMGGGTLDVAVLDVDAVPGGTPAIAVQASDGVNVAGDSLDERITQDLEALLEEQGFLVEDFPNGVLDRGWIVRAGKEAKEQLSSDDEVEVVVDHPSVRVPRVRYSRAALVAAFREQLDEAVRVTSLVLRAALMTQVAKSSQPTSLTPREARAKSPRELFEGVDFLVLVGGMANVPAIAEAFAEHIPASKIHRESDPASMVARGLGESDAFEQLNMHRPGFNIEIEWGPSAHDRHVVYAAHTPLYTDYDVFSRNATDSVFRLADELPNVGDGRLVVRSPGGEVIPIRVVEEGRSRVTPSLRFGLGRNRDAVLKMAQNGNVFIRQGNGHEMRFTIKHWPVIKGRGNEQVQIELPEAQPMPRSWYYDISGE